MNLQMLNLAIGIIFIYLTLSLIVTAFNELIESFVKWRASDLEDGIKELLKGSSNDNVNDLLQEFYKNPLIANLYRGNAEKRKNPSYIPASNFALAILNVAAPGADIGSLASIKDKLIEIPASNLKTALLNLVNAAGGDIDKARKNIEDWYNSSMDRVAGWYKRRVQWIVFGLGFTLAIVMNADTIAIFKGLSNDPALQNAIIEMAQKKLQDSSLLKIDNAKRVFVENKNDLNELRLPIGWDWAKDDTFKQSFDSAKFNRNHYLARPPKQDSGAWFLKVIGWLITGFAISLGAPFWFDLLNRIMVIRSTVKPHEKSPEEASEDRQTQPTLTIKTTT